MNKEKSNVTMDFKIGVCLIFLSSWPTVIAEPLHTDYITRSALLAQIDIQNAKPSAMILSQIVGSPKEMSILLWHHRMALMI